MAICLGLAVLPADGGNILETLAIADGRLVAESRLNHRQIQATWVSMATYAVAVASRHVETAFRILATQPAVADNYAAMFCSSGEQATSKDVER